MHRHLSQNNDHWLLEPIYLREFRQVRSTPRRRCRKRLTSHERREDGDDIISFLTSFLIKHLAPAALNWWRRKHETNLNLVFTENKNTGVAANISGGGRQSPQSPPCTLQGLCADWRAMLQKPQGGVDAWLQKELISVFKWFVSEKKHVSPALATALPELDTHSSMFSMFRCSQSTE